MAPKAKAPAKPGAKKSLPPALAKIKQELAARKEEEERLKREAEEEAKRLAEEYRLAEEQRRLEEAEAKRLAEEAAKRERKAKEATKKQQQLSAVERMQAAGTLEKIDPEEVRRQNEEKERLARLNKAKPKPKPKVEEEVDDREDWEKELDEMEAKEAAEAERAKEEGEGTDVDRIKDSNVGSLRSPICCVMGHVDAGKTSLLDKIRSTDVAGGEAGGKTQQIGATFLPRDNLVESMAKVNEKYNVTVEVPGLLVIDTPGHESFGNLRSRGSSLCDVCVLVIDITSGLQPTTFEAIRMLRAKSIPFIIAFNKVDRIYGWKGDANKSIEAVYTGQNVDTRSNFIKCYENLQKQWSDFQKEISRADSATPMELPRICLFWECFDPKHLVPIVPTSATSGDGINDLLLLMIKVVQDFRRERLTLKPRLDCVILEVKPVEGHGTTIDVIVVNGVLYEGDTIVLSGVDKAFKTQIKYLLTPMPMRELRVKGEYQHHKKIVAAMGAKIAAEGLEKAVPGTSLRVLSAGDNFDTLAKDVQAEVSDLLKVQHGTVGVCVQSSTLGSLEALLSFLKDNNIPVSSIELGPIHRRHVINAAVMKTKSPKYGVILAFDVTINDDARRAAEEKEVRIFSHDVIYQLCEAFQHYCNNYDKEEKEELRKKAIFPVIIKITQPINISKFIMAITVVRGNLYVNTPLCVMRDGSPYYIGTVKEIRTVGANPKEVQVGKHTENYTVCIFNERNTSCQYGRHFDNKCEIFSMLTRPAVDAVKHFKEELTQDSTNLLRDLVLLQKVPKVA